MAEQNTKRTVSDINVAEWEKKYDDLFANLGGFDEHEIDKITPLALHFVQAKDFIRSLLASQRHQLKQQVLAAVGTDDSEDSEIIEVNIVNNARNVLRREQRKRIEAVFEGKET